MTGEVRGSSLRKEPQEDGLNTYQSRFSEISISLARLRHNRSPSRGLEAWTVRGAIPELPPPFHRGAAESVWPITPWFWWLVGPLHPPAPAPASCCSCHAADSRKPHDVPQAFYPGFYPHQSAAERMPAGIRPAVATKSPTTSGRQLRIRDFFIPDSRRG